MSEFDSRVLLTHQHDHRYFGCDNLGTALESARNRWEKRTAFCDESFRTYTYLDLFRQAERIAAAMRQKVRPGDRVILIFESSFNAVASMIAAIRIGACYIPLSPDAGSSRIAEIWKSALPVLVVTLSSKLLACLHGGGGEEDVLCVDLLDAGHPDGTRPFSNRGPGSEAVVFYTSGSSGSPKGVVHTDANILNNIKNHSICGAIGPQDRLSNLHAFGFSPCHNEIFCALLNGAGIYSKQVNVMDARSLKTWAMACGVTVLNWIPSAFAAVCGNSDFSSTPVRLVILGSERVTPKEYGIFREVFPPASQFHIRLGMTETNNYLVNEIGTETVGPEDFTTGRIVGGFVASIRNGEIVLESDYLFKGYIGDRLPRTPEPFVTGDLGQEAGPGKMRWLGRADDMLKVDGHRVYRGEIEAAIRTSGFAEEFFLDVRENFAGKKTLVLYYTQGLPAEELRERLARVLPPYEVPKHVIPVRSIPRSPNGKVTKQGLPDPFRTVQLEDGSSTLDRIIRKYTHFDYDMDLSFFQNGGSSIDAVSFIVEIEQTFSQSLDSMFIRMDEPLRNIIGLLGQGVPNAGSAETR